MTHPIERQFYDEMDNLYEIKHNIKKKRYIKPFSFLFDHFLNDHNKWVTVTLLQEKLCIPSRSNAYDILETFRVLNLLVKKTIEHRKPALYFMINDSYWNYGKKELK